MVPSSSSPYVVIFSCSRTSSWCQLGTESDSPPRLRPTFHFPQALANGARTVFRTPLVAFLGKDNRAVYGVYGATYMTKNVTTISCNDRGWDPKWPMFFCTSIVNGCLGIMKDKYLAKMFGR